MVKLNNEGKKMKEKILVSACLLGVNCKYNGSNNENASVFAYLRDKEIIPICPEIMGGLATPRNPSERLNDKVISNANVDVTKNFQRGALETLKLAQKLGCTKAILKSKSPSCGSGTIYDGTFQGKLIEGDGLTAELLKKHNITILTEKDIENNITFML